MRYSIKRLIFISILFFLNFPSPLNAQWIKQNFPTNELLMRVRFADEMTGWILGFNYIYKTTDGGLNWMPQDSSLGYGEALYVLNNQTVFYSNYDFSSTSISRGIRRTLDGGFTWQTVDSLPFFYSDFEFLNSQLGFGVGMDENDISTVRITTDGGTSWNTLSTDFLQTGYELSCVTFLDNQVGWAASYDGYIYHTTNGGVNWVLQDSLRSIGSFLPLRDIFFVSPDSGWAVGGISGQMLTARTTNGGEDWIQNIQIGNSLREVIFINNNIGWFVGSYNSNIYVAKTTDSGVNWQNQNLVPPINGPGFESISMINENIGWAVGDMGQVYKTINGGVVGIDENFIGNELPNKFILEQNYPNPFNPETIIKYSLPEIADIKLTVYDILGREIKVLVSEKKEPGNYEVNFDAENLPCGVYIYRLKTKSFIKSQKMVLVK